MIGYAYASAFHPRSAYRYSLEDTVYIAPDHTGQGIGTALMKRLIDECTILGYRQMVALIGDKHNGFSARLHEGLGFRPVGTLTAIGFKFGRWVDVDEMQLPLGDGSHSTPAIRSPGAHALKAPFRLRLGRFAPLQVTRAPSGLDGFGLIARLDPVGGRLAAVGDDLPAAMRGDMRARPVHIIGNVAGEYEMPAGPQQAMELCERFGIDEAPLVMAQPSARDRDREDRCGSTTSAGSASSR